MQRYKVKQNNVAVQVRLALTEMK